LTVVGYERTAFLQAVAMRSFISTVARETSE